MAKSSKEVEKSFKVALKGERAGFEGGEIEVLFAESSNYIVGPGQGKDGGAVVEISFDKSGRKKVKLLNIAGELDKFGFEGKDYAEFDAKTITTFPDSHISIQIENPNGKISTVTVGGADIIISGKEKNKSQISFDKPLNVELSNNYFKDISAGNINVKAFPPQIFDAIKGLNGVTAKEFTIKGKAVRLFAVGKEGEAQIYCGVSNKFIKLEEIFDLGAGEGYHTLGFRFRAGEKGKIGKYNARIEGVTGQEVAALMDFVKTQAGETFVKTGSPGMQIGEANLNFNQKQTSQKIVDLTKKDLEDEEKLRLREESERNRLAAEKAQEQADNERAERERAQQEAEQARQKQQEAENERERAQRGLEEAQQSAAANKNKIIEQDATIAELSAKIAELESLGLSAKEVQRLQNELNARIEEQQKKEEELKQREKAVEEGQAALDKARKEDEEKRKAEENEKRAKEAEELKQKIETLTTSTGKLKEAKSKYSDKYKALQAKIERVKDLANPEKAEEAKDEIKRLRAEIDSSYNELDKQFNEAEGLAEEVKEGQKEIENPPTETPDEVKNNIEQVKSEAEAAATEWEKAKEDQSMDELKEEVENLQNLEQPENEEQLENEEQPKNEEELERGERVILGPREEQNEEENPQPEEDKKPESQEAQDKESLIKRYEELLQETRKSLDQQEKNVSLLARMESLIDEQLSDIGLEKGDESQEAKRQEYVKEALSYYLEKGPNIDSVTTPGLDSDKYDIGRTEDVRQRINAGLENGKEKLIEQGKELKELREKILEADPEQLTFDDRVAYRGVIKGIENATGINFTQTEPGNFQRQQTEIRQVDNLTETQNFAQTEQENPQPEQTEIQNLAQTEQENPQPEQTETQNLAQTGQEKPQPEQQAQQPPENNPEEDKKDEKKKKQASPEQSEFKRGQVWRGVKYSLLGALCGLLFVATLLLGLAGMLPVFFICLASTIGACVITSGEATEDIIKAKNQSLKAKTEKNKQREEELSREIERENQAEQEAEQEAEEEQTVQEQHEEEQVQEEQPVEEQVQEENGEEQTAQEQQENPAMAEEPVETQEQEEQTEPTAPTETEQVEFTPSEASPDPQRIEQGLAGSALATETAFERQANAINAQHQDDGRGI